MTTEQEIVITILICAAMMIIGAFMISRLVKE
jgi:hypothetical protein